MRIYLYHIPQVSNVPISLELIERLLKAYPGTLLIISHDRELLNAVPGRIAHIEGVPELHGAPVCATDLRGGAALVIAGLMARGVTEVFNPGNIARGYEHLETKLNDLGARIVRAPLEPEENGDANRI